jgi:hypothetical protein
MKFLLTYSSGDKHPKMPVEKLTLTYVDVRTCSLAELQTKPWGKEFLSSGKNHKDLPNGYCSKEEVRNLRYQIISIDSIEELLQFKKEVGDLIIASSSYLEFEHEIEVYDGWRE